MKYRIRETRCDYIPVFYVEVCFSWAKDYPEDIYIWNEISKHLSEKEAVNFLEEIKKGKRDEYGRFKDKIIEEVEI